MVYTGTVKGILQDIRSKDDEKLHSNTVLGNVSRANITDRRNESYLLHQESDFKGASPTYIT